MTSTAVTAAKALTFLLKGVSLEVVSRPLTREALKSHFRRRAKDCHPDTAVHSQEAQREFIKLTRAYRYLDGLVQQGQDLNPYLPALRPAAPVPPPKPTPRKPFVRTPEPVLNRSGKPRPGTALVRFGHFLLGQGVITMDQLIASLVWQSARRPRYGILASRLGFLTQEQILEVLGHGRLGERFGETALRLGLLSQYQHLVILGMQRKYRAPLGEYFLLSGLLNRTQLEGYLRAHRGGRVPMAGGAA